MEPSISVGQTQPKSIFQKPLVMVFTALLCCALWGSATPFIKTGYQIMFPDGKPDIPSAILFAGIRFFLSGLITVLFYSTLKKRFVYPHKENWGIVGIIALFQTVIQYFFYYIGLANTSGTKGTVISGSTTFFAILISALLFRQEKLTVKKLVACAIGFSGILLINFNGLDFHMNLLGDGFVLISTVSSAMSSVLIKTFSGKENPVITSGYQFALGGLVLILGGLLFGGRIDLSTLKGDLVLLYLGFLSAVAYGLWGVLLKYNPVSKVTVFTFTTPVFGVTLTHLMLPAEDTQVSVWNLLLSLVAVCIGVVLLNLEKPAKNCTSGK